MNAFQQIVRGISTSAVRQGRKSFRKFWVPHSIRGSIHDRQVKGVEDESYGQRMPFLEGTEQIEPELIPELVVPNLEGFKLKPYVSYNVPDVVQSEFTANVSPPLSLVQF